MFSDVSIYCLPSLADSEKDLCEATVRVLGGECRADARDGVTHLVTRVLKASDLDDLRNISSGMMMCFVHPQWIMDSVRLRRRVPSEPYILESANEPAPFMRPEWQVGFEELERVDTPGWDSVFNSQKIAARPMSSALEKTTSLFEGKKIILGCQIELSSDFRVFLGSAVVINGGDILSEDAVLESDIYITPFREGEEYLLAVELGKLIGSLPWLIHVLNTGRMTAPTDNLLHYPIPRGGIPDFRSCTISVSNYTGEARDYLKRLILSIGSKYTTALVRDVNTHLVAATTSGEKFSKATNRHNLIVNHLYLEDCFTQWKRLPESADNRYTPFSNGVNCISLLGKAKLTDEDLKRWTAPANGIAADNIMQLLDGDITATSVKLPTQASLPPKLEHHTVVQQALGPSWGEINTAGVEMHTFMAPMKGDAGDAPMEMDQVIEDAPAEPSLPTHAHPPPLSPSKDVAPQDVYRADEPEVNSDPLVERSHNPSPQAQQDEHNEMILQKSVRDESLPIHHGESVPSQLSVYPEGHHVMAQASKDDQVIDMVQESLRLAFDGEDLERTDQEEDVTMPFKVSDAPFKSFRSTTTRLQSEGHAAPATQSSTRAAQTAKSSRLASPTNTQSGKRRRRESEPAEMETQPPVVPPSPKSQRRNAADTPDSNTEDTTFLHGEKGVTHLETSDTQGTGPTERTAAFALSPRAVKLMSSGFNLAEDLIKTLKGMGVKIASRPSNMTHLITRTAKRTMKLLMAIARGVDVTSTDWVEQCTLLKRMVDPEPYWLKDPENERKFGYNLAQSIHRSRALKQEQGGLLAGRLFHITSKVKPGFEQIQDVVKAAGGHSTRYISGRNRLPKKGQDPLILISCEEDKDVWRDLLQDNENVVVYDKELLLTSILKMELDMNSHLLTI